MGMVTVILIVISMVQATIQSIFAIVTSQLSSGFGPNVSSTRKELNTCLVPKEIASFGTLCLGSSLQMAGFAIANQQEHNRSARCCAEKQKAGITCIGSIHAAGIDAHISRERALDLKKLRTRHSQFLYRLFLHWPRTCVDSSSDQSLK
jgi:hypothetical protein